MSDAALFSIESPRISGDPGEVEGSFIEQIQFLEKAGVMTAAHAGLKALVLRAARAVDEIRPNDAASGRAQLMKTLSDVAAMLPAPKTEEASVIDQLAALFDVDTNRPGEYDRPPQ